MTRCNRKHVLAMMHMAQGDSTLTNFAEQVGCSAAYLSMVYAGKKEPGPKLLDHLGLERQVQIRKIVTYTSGKERRWR
jgi:hypothetical protein